MQNQNRNAAFFAALFSSTFHMRRHCRHGQALSTAAKQTAMPSLKVRFFPSQWTFQSRMLLPSKWSNKVRDIFMIYTTYSHVRCLFLVSCVKPNTYPRCCGSQPEARSFRHTESASSQSFAFVRSHSAAHSLSMRLHSAVDLSERSLPVRAVRINLFYFNHQMRYLPHIFLYLPWTGTPSLTETWCKKLSAYGQ